MVPDATGTGWSVRDNDEAASVPSAVRAILTEEAEAVAVAGSGGWTRSVLNDEETEKYRHDTTQRMRRKIRT